MCTFVTVNMGIVYIILSGICFLIVNFFVKTLGPGQSNIFTDHLQLQEYPAHELVLARSVVSFAMSWVIVKRKKLPVFGNNKKWLIIRGLSGTIALTIFFYTMHYLPLAVALTVQYLAPIFTIIFAMILLRERIRWIQWPFIGLAFGGTLLLVYANQSDQPDLAGIDPFWLGLGMISAVLSGVAYVSIMKLKQTDAPITIVMYFPMVAIPFMVVLCIWEFTMPQGIEWIFLLIIGVFTQLAQITMTRALHAGNAATIVPFQYLGAIYGFLVGYFIFLESLSSTLIVGMVLVLAGVIVNSILRQRA
ncbi:MAG: DMT family transporter [Crocinitomicaceae bacterium]